MSAAGQPSAEQLEALRIPEAYVAQWLDERGYSWEDLAAARVVVGDHAVTLSEVEDLVAAEDPTIWAWLNLVEKNPLTIEGEAVVREGEPWALFPIQADLSRCHGDLIVECGAEVGKTRDIVLQLLWCADTRPGATQMAGGDSDQTLIPIYEELEYQLEQNPAIAGGLAREKCHIKPNRKLVFQNGSAIELRLATINGKNFRGGHFTAAIYADEAAMWKNPRQWSEFFRSALPGCVARIYSTPDGDYSSPFYAMCARAQLVGGTDSSPSSSTPLQPVKDGERRFRKFHISKTQLPEPFWSEQRRALLREQFGGEHTAGYITNVLGNWGSPMYSVFPMPTLEPCLSALERYALVTVLVDRRERQASLAAARLDGVAEDEPTEERIVARDRFSLPDEIRAAGVELGRRIASFFPEISDLVSPRLYVGADLGSAQDPSEIVFVQVVGKTWTDVFRLHLRGAEWNEQEEIFYQLDHASGHRAIYSLDNGSAGSLLVSNLTQAPRECASCPTTVRFSERLVGRGFGEGCDAINIETGEPILNPNDRDASGNPRPFRLLNKEFSTRVLEQKLAARELVIARDGGAGDQRLSGPQLLVNHTASGTNKRGERNFRGVDDHHPDARRLIALAIVDELRERGSVGADPNLVATSGQRRTAYDLDIVGPSVAADFGISRLEQNIFEP